MLHQPGRASHHTSYILHQHDTWPRPLGCTCEPAKLEPCWNLPVHWSIGAAGAIPNSWRSHHPSSIIHPKHPICKPSSAIHQSVIRNLQSAICNLQKLLGRFRTSDFMSWVPSNRSPYCRLAHLHLVHAHRISDYDQG